MILDDQDEIPFSSYTPAINPVNSESKHFIKYHFFNVCAGTY